MKAFLINYRKEEIAEVRPVEISDDHDWLSGPYVDTVPFSVGSNETIIPYEDGEKLYLKYLETSGE